MKTSSPTSDTRATDIPAVEVAPSPRPHGRTNPDEIEPLPRSLGEKLGTLTVVVLPLLAVFVAVALSWGRAFNWTFFGITVVMYLISGLGITIGFHRYFTHKSFETKRPIVTLMAIAGSMAVEGPLLEWCAYHRRHHQYSDEENDPHSPHFHGDGFFGILRGAWHAHIGWLFRPHPRDLARYIADLRRDQGLRVISNLFLVWVMLGLALPTIAGGLLTMSWYGALLGLIWGGLVRIFLVHHVTWSINSVCHLWGSRPYQSHDESRNNPIFGILGMGEGWHNTHHAFPTSARHGLEWWQFDLSYLIIRGLGLVGLASDIKVPDTERRASKLRGS